MAGTELLASNLALEYLYHEGDLTRHTLTPAYTNLPLNREVQIRDALMTPGGYRPFDMGLTYGEETLEDMCRCTRKTGPAHVAALVLQEEENYLEKWNLPRNWWVEKLFQQKYDRVLSSPIQDTEVDVPFTRLVEWGYDWLRTAVGVPGPLPSYQSLSCPKWSANTGVVKFLDGRALYSSATGEHWTEIVHLAEAKDREVRRHIYHLPEVEGLRYDARSEWLDELLGCGVSFVRKDGGPDKGRLVINVPKDAYVRAVRFLQMAYTPHYKRSGLTMAHTSNLVIRGHQTGACVKHSGDWSEWDMRLAKIIQVAALVAIGKHLGVLHLPEFRIAAYEAVYLPVYLQGKFRYWEGRSKSGGGLFVLVNNVANAIIQALINYRLGVVAQLPCNHGDDFVQFIPRIIEGYVDEFSKIATEYGFKAKAEAQHANRDAFVACRLIHCRDVGWAPRVILASVLRNYLWPGYEVMAPEHRNLFVYAVRHRDLRKTLRYHPKGRKSSALLESALSGNGLPTPGLDYLTEQTLSREITHLVEMNPYSLSERLQAES